MRRDGCVRILIVGDSLSLPRSYDGQNLAQCWPSLLKTSLPHADVWVRSEPGTLVDRALAQVRLFESSLDLVDVVIVQAGITDSCPRPIPYWLNYLLGRAWNGKLLRLINRNYRKLLRLRSTSWTTEAKFRAVLLEIINRATPTSTVLFVPIVRPCKKLAAKAPASPRAAARYNKIMLELCETYGAGRAGVLDEFERACSENYVLDDGHHLNALGHRLLADHLSEALVEESLVALAA